jgi:hypothetical protein
MKTTASETIKRLTHRGFVTIFIVSVLTFVGFKIYPIIHGPAINVTTLVNGGNISDPMIRISGNAAFTQQLVINGKNLNLAPNGAFDEKLILNPGYNVVTLTGSDRFGKSNSTTYTIVLTEATPPATLTRNTPSSSPIH